MEWEKKKRIAILDFSVLPLKPMGPASLSQIEADSS